jgi:RNA polymerase sigma factor (sigma-70 family)
MFCMNLTKNKRLIHLDPDSRLMVKAAKGDKKAYGRLYIKYYHVVVSFVASFNGHNSSPEDIAQEVFCRILAKIEEYQPLSNFKTFLLGCAKNVISECNQHQPANSINLEEMIDYVSDPAEIALRKELIHIIEKAKKQLSRKQLQALALKYYSNSSINEAVKKAGCSNMVYRHRVLDAKKRMSALLQYKKSCLISTEF